jgi:hypothetical protein
VSAGSVVVYKIVEDLPFVYIILYWTSYNVGEKAAHFNSRYD